MTSKLIYYVYAYIRAKDSTTAKAGTPYYIGKGKGNRAFTKHHCNIQLPKNNSHIIFLETNLTELGALAIERRMIAWYGRKDVKTGILLNRTDGGDGLSGHKQSAEHIAKIHKPLSEETKAKLRKPKSEAAKLNMRKPKSEEHKAKLSKASKGIQKSEEHREKIRNARLGKCHSEEAKANMSRAAKNRRRNKTGSCFPLDSISDEGI